MAAVTLRQILGKPTSARAVVDALATALGDRLTIEDADGRVLRGARETNGGAPASVSHDGRDLGRVTGERAAQLATLLEHLVAAETERKALGAEVLNLYREINLIYAFSESLAALLDLDRVAALTLQKARQVIVATDGALMLLADGSDELHVVAGFGDELAHVPALRRGHGIIGTVAATGVGEIVNDVDQDARRAIERTPIRALVCAPLTVGERVIGIIALASTVPMGYTAGELKLLTTLALQAATAIENARLFERTVQAAQERERLLSLHQQAELARERLEGEMKLAARIQRDLFPATLPDVAGYECAARNRPARRCGGDYYDVLQVPGPGNRLLFCVADVAGKGLPAALLMSNMQATLRALLGRVEPLPSLADVASDLLFQTTAPEKYATAALVELTPEAGTLTFVGAGHLDNLLLRADGTITRLSSTGMPLGLLQGGFPYTDERETMQPGDAVVLYSDGVTDAQNETGEEFGEAALLDVLAGAAGAPASALIDGVLDAIDRFAGGAPQFDDITLLVVRRVPGT